MPRQPRIFCDPGFYHVVTRGNNRQPLFKDDLDFQTFLFLLKLLRKEYQFEVYHYCLMTNHVHLLMRFYDDEAFQKVMQRVNLKYAKGYARKYHHVGHVFQDRFRSFPIKDEAYLLECGRYIERNPLKAKMVNDPSGYPWSSYAYYGLGKENALLTTNPLYLALGVNPEERRIHYKTYILSERPYEKAVEQAIYGIKSRTKLSL